MATIWIIVLTVIGTIFFEVLLLIVFSWGSDRVQYNEVHEWNPNHKQEVGKEWIEENGWRDRGHIDKIRFIVDGQEIPPPYDFSSTHNQASEFVNGLFETRKEYLFDLPELKKIIDKSPNMFLKHHLISAIREEQYELAQYIVDVAKERGFNLEAKQL